MAEQLLVHHLPDGGNHHIGFESKLRAFDFHGAAATAGIGFAELHLDALDGGNLSVFFIQPQWSNQIPNFDSFFFSSFDFRRGGGHFCA